MFNEEAPALKGVVGAVSNSAAKHPAGRVLANCTLGVKAGALAVRNLDAPECKFLKTTDNSVIIRRIIKGIII